MFCIIDGCNRERRRKEYCYKHSYAYHDKRSTNSKVCTLEGCGLKHYAKGYCHYHYIFFKRTHATPCKVVGCGKKAKKGNIYCYFHRLKIEKGLPFENDRKGKNNKNWKGGVSNYPNHHVMKKIRKERLSQTNGRCEDCGVAAKKLHMHHIDFSKNNHTPENLKLLCPCCHKKYHRKGQEALNKGDRAQGYVGT